MEYYYSKSKFSNDFFFKKIQLGKVKHTSGVFQVSIFPFLNYSGIYHIIEVHFKDNTRTVYLVTKLNNGEIQHTVQNQFYISLSHDGKKFMIFNENLDGIILKS